MERSSSWSGSASLYSVILRQTVPMQILVIVLGLLLPPLAVVPLQLQRRIIDEALPAADIELLLTFVAVYVAATLLRLGIKFVVVYLRGWIAEIVARVLRTALIEARRRLRREGPPPNSLGAAISVMTAEVDPLGEFAAEALNTPLIQGGIMVSVLGFMFVAEPELAAIAIVALVTESLITPLLQHWINILTFKRIRTLRRAGHDLIESTRSEARSSLIDALREVRFTYRLRLRMNFLKALLRVTRNLIDHSAEIAVLGFGVWMVTHGETKIGVVVAFLSGLRQLRDPWSELVSFYRRLVNARVKYRLVYGLIKPAAQ